MEPPTLRKTCKTCKTCKAKLKPTPAQERVLHEILWRCRELDTTALAQRIVAWQGRQVSVSRDEQEAALTTIRAEFPQYPNIHSPILQAVLGRWEKAYQAFFRRLARGEQAGVPRFQGRGRIHSSPATSRATALAARTASWRAPRSGAAACSGPAPLKADQRWSRSHGRPRAGTWRAPVPMCRRIRSRKPGKGGASTGASTGAWSPSLLAARGSPSFPPAPLAKPTPPDAAVTDGSPAAGRGAIADARPSSCWHKPTNPSTTSDATSTIRKQRNW